jgi:hypothetical protein
MRDEHDDECSFYQFCVYDDLLAVAAPVIAAAAAAVVVAAFVLLLTFYILHKEINYF